MKTHFGYSSFRFNQEQIIKDVLDKKNVLTIMPTGGGKSICFQLPALLMEGTAIVISPLIALMKDQVDALKANDIPAAFINSSQDSTINYQVLKMLNDNKLKLLYIAPESLANIFPQIPNVKISLFAIDEAHCISSWGHDFRPAYTQLGYLKKKFPEIPIAAFTATADKATRKDIVDQLNVPDATVHISSFDRPNLFLEVRPANNRLNQILKFLDARPFESGIIYCLSRKSTESITAKLNKSGHKAKAYHAGLSAEERIDIQESFIANETPIIVATIAFGMGIDKGNVRFVIHYNLPKNIEGYYQEIGRGGRDGLPSQSLLFYSFADVIQLRQFIDDATNKEYQNAKLDRMQQYAEANSCRRVVLLNYFGEFGAENCNNCDVCLAPPKYFDGTLIAQKVCSGIARLKEQESTGMVIDVLRGAQNAQVLEKKYQHIKTYGILKNTSWLDLQQYIIQMINQGILEIRFHEKGRLLLTKLAKDILFENKQVSLVSIQKFVAAQKVQKIQKEILNVDAALFQKLKELRLKIAKEENLPAFVIFNDASLRDMADRQPQNLTDFEKISGVGAVKLEKFGQQFLEVIVDHLALE
ncbi:DNA helicase RecQ [Frigoriflavimonas asaccharolytica]|uniref:DNA helicase RecQ n=1 Tax=Frigoriflavimonas asaccharolytica TaxID=2735899 RepID=UPI0021D18CAC|nr:DNA helicase RecQ [Frigoriflavimonas asaccharolytica]